MYLRLSAFVQGGGRKAGYENENEIGGLNFAARSSIWGFNHHPMYELEGTGQRRREKEICCTSVWYVEMRPQAPDPLCISRLFFLVTFIFLLCQWALPAGFLAYIRRLTLRNKTHLRSSSSYSNFLLHVASRTPQATRPTRWVSGSGTIPWRGNPQTSK